MSASDLGAGDPELEAERRHEAGRWLAVARADTRAATLALNADPPLLGITAYHCQQAAEKLMKGLLVLAQQPFAKTHDLEKLGALVASCYPAWERLLALTGGWTVWGFAYRYPELEKTPEPSPDMLRRALQTIEELEAHLVELGASEPSP